MIQVTLQAIPKAVPQAMFLKNLPRKIPQPPLPLRGRALSTEEFSLTPRELSGLL
jgi:hypothetical protein